jgi:ATP-dependent helicase/nuclease subunit A
LIQPAKSSVSRLRRAMQAEEEAAYPFFRPKTTGQDPLEKGLAAHRFLELLRLELPSDPASLAGQLADCVAKGHLSKREAELVDLSAIAAFWGNEVGLLLLSERKNLRREFPFTFRLNKADAQSIASGLFTSLPEEDFVVVQGIADLVVLKPEEIWLLDFKTDSVPDGNTDRIVEKYRPQVELYAFALGSILNRRVSRRWLHFLSCDRTVELPPLK